MKRILHWLVDSIHFFRGHALMYAHREPPKHYLGYILEGRCPVIIVSGIGTHWGFIKPLGDAISLEGHPTYIVPKLENNLKDIPTSAKLVRELIEEQDLKDAVIVAHSKGGLIGKYLLAYENEDKRVRGLVAIATPFSGSSLAELIPRESHKELLRDSEIIKKLKGHKESNKKIISIIPEFDNFVWAEEGSFLEGALDNIEVDVQGHNKVVYDKKTYHEVKKAIDRLAKLK